ncbi:hypothetical protein ACVILK_003851 [Bradyrhizobium embrapense]
MRGPMINSAKPIISIRGTKAMGFAALYVSYGPAIPGEFPSPLVGEGGRDAQHRGRVRGPVSADGDPSSGADCIRATFSHKGRREEASAQSCPSSVSPPETSTLPGAGSLLSFFTTPSSTSIE